MSDILSRSPDAFSSSTAARFALPIVTCLAVSVFVMAPILPLLTLIGLFVTVLGDNKGLVFSPFDPLGPGDYLASQNGTMFLTMQLDGNVALYEGGNPGRRGRRLWQTSTKGFGQNLLVLEKDCSLSVYNGLQYALATISGRPATSLWNSNWPVTKSSTGKNTSSGQSGSNGGNTTLASTTTMSTVIEGGSSGLVTFVGQQVPDIVVICFGLINEQEKSFVLFQERLNETDIDGSIMPLWSTKAGKLDNRQRGFFSWLFEIISWIINFNRACDDCVVRGAKQIWSQMES